MLVDLRYDAIATLQRTPQWGAVYTGWMHEQIAAVCPRPHELRPGTR